MAGRAGPGAQSDVRESLVRLGHLCFDDFLLLSTETLDIGHWTSDLASDWSLALNNAPNLFLHFHRLFPDSSFILHPSSLSDTASAQSRLVHTFAYELLRAKAPPLYDALPWQDWDFSIVAKRFRLWQTRFLLAGDGTTVTMCRCRRSAGVYILEPNETIARYVELKCAKEKVRRLKLLRTGPDRIPLPDHSTDLAVVGSVPELHPSALAELTRVATNVLLIENSPLSPPLEEAPLTAAGFRPGTVDVSGRGPRPCWWLPGHSIP
jgi:hypothetical protein